MRKISFKKLAGSYTTQFVLLLLLFSVKSGHQSTLHSVLYYICDTKVRALVRISKELSTSISD